MDELTIAVVDPHGEQARFALGQYFAELDERFEEGFDAAAAMDEAAESLVAPLGSFVVATIADDVVGCGAVLYLDDERAEIKRMWIDGRHRGLGLGKRLLAHLEQEISDTGRTEVLLDTNRALPVAAAMYRAFGYTPTERYNDNPYAHLWFRKQLPAPSVVTMADDALTGETTELLQALIRNACVNDGTPDSGDEIRNADVLQTFLEGAGLDVQRFESRPDRASVVARIEGSDPERTRRCA